VVFLILESLGSTELVFILIMALVFFGPRKLPQISRSLGKNLADFRRASEDFKRTWDREVNLEDTGSTTANANRLALPEQNSFLDNETASQPWQASTIAAIAPDQVVARDTLASETIHASDPTGSPTGQSDLDGAAEKHSPKSDWL
jgi:sec-independent protein translocase protein TatB